MTNDVRSSKETNRPINMFTEHNMLDKLYKEVVVSPYDSNNVKRYFHEFEISSRGDDKLYSAYLILKYFHDPMKYEHLNALGDLYLDQNKYYLASLCFIESIRLNPSQSEIFRKYDMYKDYLKPDFLKVEKEQEPTISVIMGTYNRNMEIIESIESILKQTHQDFEILLINDGGNIEVENVLRALNSSKINYIKFEENRGHAAVLNEGIRRSRGKYIAYLDDDDIYYRNHLELLSGALKDNKCDIAYSNTKMVEGSMEKGCFHANKIKGYWNVEFDKNELINNNYISNLCIMHEKYIFSEVGLYFEDLRMVMDWELWLRASLKYKFYHVDAYTGEYRFKENNVTSSHRLIMDFYEELVRNYYLYYRGLISCLKHYQWNKWNEKAKTIYSNIKEEYEYYFKAPKLYQELLDLSYYYNDHVFSGKIASDYFQIDPRNFIRYIKTRKRLSLLFPVSPLIPTKIMNVIKNRINR